MSRMPRPKGPTDTREVAVLSPTSVVRAICVEALYQWRKRQGQNSARVGKHGDLGRIVVATLSEATNIQVNMQEATKLSGTAVASCYFPSRGAESLQTVDARSSRAR